MRKILITSLSVFLFSVSAINAQESNGLEIEPTKAGQTEFWEPRVPVVTVARETGVPSDAIVLFDGSNLDGWVSSSDSSSSAEWNLNGDGSMTVKNKSGNIQTKKSFGSVQLHIEWRSPEEVQGKNQSRGNSGVFLQKLYEVQVLDNNDNDTYVNGQVGSIYKWSMPLAMASSPTGEWNSYDMIYHAPVFEKGYKKKSGTITVMHNGVLILDHHVILGSTEYVGWPKNKPHGKLPLMLQDHGDNSRVSYRNIWVREID